MPSAPTAAPSRAALRRAWLVLIATALAALVIHFGERCLALASPSDVQAFAIAAWVCLGVAVRWAAFSGDLDRLFSPRGPARRGRP